MLVSVLVSVIQCGNLQLQGKAANAAGIQFRMLKSYITMDHSCYWSFSVLVNDNGNFHLQGKAADAAGIQFRMLNASKGPAVRGPRAQMDQLYKHKMQQLLADVPGLEVVDGAVTNVLLESNKGSEVAQQSAANQAIAGVMLASGDACILGADVTVIIAPCSSCTCGVLLHIMQAPVYHRQLR